MKKVFSILLIILTLAVLASAAMAEGWAWSSSDESVIHVWPDGSLVVRGVGTAILTGTAQDESGNTVTISISVPEVYAAASSETPYIGNINTKKFHRFNCASVNDIKEGNKASLASREEAIEQGYAPCQRCNP